jgi:holo-[acyl-carrier protein] synthase
MIVGVGTDIVQIDRIEETLGRLGQKFAERILAPQELQDYLQSPTPHRFLAKRFAAKEALGKALGTGIGQGVSWQHIEVSHSEWGAPLLNLSGEAEARMDQMAAQSAHLSIADEKDYALAFVVLSAS